MVTTHERSGSGSDPNTKLTYEDYMKTSDDERWELIDGVLIEMPSPTVPHQRVSRKIGTRLDIFVDAGSLGEVFHAPIDVVLDETVVVQPDLVFVSNERMRIVEHLNIQGAPDLVVEIRSPSTARHDEVTKRALYERYGVLEYWLADPEAQTVTVLILGESGYDVVGIYNKGDTLTSPTLEGFSLNLDDIFRTTMEE